MHWGARKNDAFNSKQGSQRVCSHLWAVAHEDVLRRMWLWIFPGSGFLCVFAAGSRMVGTCHDPRLHRVSPAGCFLSIILLFASLAQVRDYCHQKKSLGKKKKKKKKVCHCRKHLLSHFFLLSCHLLSRRSDATGFSHPFSWRMLEPGRWVGSKGGSSGVPTTAKSSFGGGWQGGWACLSKPSPYILMDFWLDMQSTAESHKRKRLWHIYTVCWHQLLKKNSNIPDYLRFVLEVWSPHVIQKPSGIHSWTSSPP